MSYFRIKEITAPATILRQGNLLGLDLGDFIYPDEIETLASSAPIVYWDDRTGEHFTWNPGTGTAAPVAAIVAAIVAETPIAAPVVEATVKEVVVPSTMETGSEDTKA